MDEEPQNQDQSQDCGCNCEACKAGNHHECTTGMCMHKDKEEPTAPEE